jgi:hypothetical protein
MLVHTGWHRLSLAPAGRAASEHPHTERPAFSPKALRGDGRGGRRCGGAGRSARGRAAPRASPGCAI